MRKLFSDRKRFIGLGLVSAFVLALAVLGTLWGLDQTASADPDGVSLVHLNPDGTDFVGNPYCPQTVWSPKLTLDPRHDCNNITSQEHVIRTDGWDDTMTEPDWVLEGVGQVRATGRCGDLDEVKDRPNWGTCDDADDDDGDTVVNDGCPMVDVYADCDLHDGAEGGPDGDCLDDGEDVLCANAVDDDADTVVNDGCPAVGVSEDLGAQQCLVIHSSHPGETSITLTYEYPIDGESGVVECGNDTDDDGDTVVNDGCPAVGDGAINDGCPKVATNDDPGDDAVANDGCPMVGDYADCDTNEDGDCLSAGEPALCGNDTDDDGDTTVDDGCPQVGTTGESGAQCIDPESGDDCADAVDDDGDTLVNDGCPMVGATAESGDQCTEASGAALDDDEATDPEEGAECTEAVGSAVDDDSDGFVNDGCPVVLSPEDTATATTDAVIKEWDKLKDTVILKADDVESVTVPDIGSVKLPKDANNNGVRDADDAHILDHNGETQDHAIIWDEARKELRASLGPIQLIEVVHGQHGTSGWAADHPTEGAVILAFIDSPNKAQPCTHFTNPVVIDLDGDTTPDYQPGELDLGTAMVGISDWRGFFIGPKLWPVGAQLSAEALAEAADALLSPPMSNNSGVIAFPPIPFFEANYVGVYVDTTCEEQATITFKVGYPDYVQSDPPFPEVEQVTINWTKVEAAKQPQIRWAGEEIVLEKRWAVPGEWYPEAGGIDNDGDGEVNEDTGDVSTDDDDGDTLVDEDPKGDGDRNGMEDGSGPVPPGTGDCRDGTDNDGDGKTDANDPECKPFLDDDGDMADHNEDGTDAAVPGTGDCLDGTDNDGDGKTDADDPDCKKWIDEDWGDDDNDGLEDGTAVPGNPGPRKGNCADGTDNDGDTLIDEDDPDCWPFIDEDPLDFCPPRLHGALVQYIKLDGPGGLVGGPDSVWTTIDENCVSRAVYSSEEPGQVNVEAVLYDPTTPEEIDNKHAFLVWYIKIYELKLTNVPGERADHNAGKFAVGEGADLYDPDVGDLEAETLNVSQDALLRVRVKGWFPSADCGGRGDVCVDMDGDGNGLEGEEASQPGVPYPAVSHVGCADDDDLLLPDGYCVLPDDMEKLAGPHPDRVASWDVMSEPNVSASALIGPKSTLDSHDDDDRLVVPCVPPFGKTTCTRKTVDPDLKITEADALMPPLKILAALGADEAGFLKPADKGADVGIDSAYQSVMIPANQEIPPIVNNGGYDWDSWGWNVVQYAYPFFAELTKTTDPDGLGLIRDFEFYTDNRGEGFFFVNGDYNLTYDDCGTDPVSQAPDCSSDDVVGITEISVIGDYPYFRKHPAVESNLVTKSWIWGGDKRVTSERIDATHIAIIAHLKDRDGFCKYDVDYPDVTTSPSLNPVQLEEIEFILNTGAGSILDVSSNGAYNPAAPHDPLTDAVVTGAQDGFINAGKDSAVALAEDARVLAGLEDEGLVDVGARAPSDEDECQAWVLIQHPIDEDPDVSVVFNDPEGVITRHWPPSTSDFFLVGGPSEQQMPPLWNDVCYIGPDQDIEDAMEDIIADALAIYRFTNDADQTWEHHFPGRCDTEGLCTIETLKPYDQLFILMADSATWTQEITVGAAANDKDEQVALVELWNSVCYAGDSKPVDDATAAIVGDYVILYTLANQTWQRQVPGRADLTNIGTLNKYTSVVVLVTNAAGTTWVFDP